MGGIFAILLDFLIYFMPSFTQESVLCHLQLFWGNSVRQTV